VKRLYGHTFYPVWSKHRVLLSIYNMMKLPPDRNTAFPDKSPFKTILQGIKADNILYLFVKQDIITIFAHYQK
jgi:hypothetical protein